MHYSRTLVLIFAGLGLASPSPSPVSLLRRDAIIDRSLKLTDHTAHIELANFEKRADGLSERSLEKRKDVKICTARADKAGDCVTIGPVIAKLSFDLADKLKGNSDSHDCSAHSGSFDRVAWKVYATGSSCDTTAERDTFQGAIAKYLEKQDDKVCGVHCLRLTHGGTYQGYVTLAPAGTKLDSFYCGPNYSFGSCVSGGKYDIPS